MDDTSLAVWLSLRERADRSSRSAALANAMAAMLPAHRPVDVLDLATGSGSNLRYLVERLPARQRWLVVDRSPVLLSEVMARTSTWATKRGYQLRSDEAGFVISGDRLDCRVDLRARDLGALDEAEIFLGRHLVTASALLDLVSAQWLRRLAARCRADGAAVLVSLTYDGRFSCIPAEPEDELVRGLFNAHQGGDQGWGGPAAGPAAAECAARCFAENGYRVTSVTSDWMLDAGDAPLQRQLIEGWADAAAEMAPHLAETIASWRARRLAHVDGERSHIVVGHRDLAAWRREGGSRGQRA